MVGDHRVSISHVSAPTHRGWSPLPFGVEARPRLRTLVSRLKTSPPPFGAFSASIYAGWKPYDYGESPLPFGSLACSPCAEYSPNIKLTLAQSPLPFGVQCVPRPITQNPKVRNLKYVSIAFRRSVRSPQRLQESQSGYVGMVSIAFRRSVRSPPNEKELVVGPEQGASPLPFGVQCVPRAMILEVIVF